MNENPELASNWKGRVLMQIDCEGCEWAAVEQMSGEPLAARRLRRLKLLFFEAHLAPTMMTPSVRRKVKSPGIAQPFWCS